MENRKKYLILILLIILLAGILSYDTNPLLQARVFAALRGRTLENAIESGGSIPEADMQFWDGEHPMYEFPLSSLGLGSDTVYYGCYYSPDDIPLSFQNAGFPLIQHGHEYWKWSGEGDNHGVTQRLRPGWYYYEAHF